MKEKLINYFFDSKEEYEEVAVFINTILILVPIAIVSMFI